MNAQEAIGITRKKLVKLEDYHDLLQRQKEFLINNRIFDKVEIEKMLEDSKAEIDALSIVLESARLLHGSNQVIHQNDTGKVAMIEFYPVAGSSYLKAIGIEEGANQ